MSRRKRALNLTAQERQTLEQLRDHHAKSYLRERASALLRISAGQAASAVARQGVLKPRAPDTVYEWLNRYLQNGSAGLYQRPRRKRAFSP